MLHDEVMPAAGKARAAVFGEPVSAFNLADEEEEMHDRVWRFLVAPHARDWFMDTVVELQRTRIIGVVDKHFDRTVYFRWLSGTRYASSRVRFRTLADSTNSDVDTAPAVMRSICAVIEMDERRAKASSKLRDLGAEDVVKRRAENELFISWFTRAIRYRYEAYNYALDHLLVETPHEGAIGADAEISDMAIYVERAEAGDFCFDDNDDALIIDEGRHGARVLMGPAGEDIVRK